MGRVLCSSGWMNGEQQETARRRRTRAEVRHLVSEFVSSGMRRSEFCRSRGVSYSTLDRHLKKQRWKRETRRASVSGCGDPPSGISMVRTMTVTADEGFVDPYVNLIAKRS